MQQALHNHFFHIFIVVLVCLDAAIVLFELLLDVGALGKEVKIAKLLLPLLCIYMYVA